MVNDGIWTKFPQAWARALVTIPIELYKHFHLIKDVSYITNYKLDDMIQNWRALFTFQVVRKYFINKKWRSVGMYTTASSINWHVWQPTDSEGCRCIVRMFYLLCPMPPHVLVDFVVLPPGHGRSVTDFWGWDAHEAQLRCPDDVSGDIGGCSAIRTP